MLEEFIGDARPVVPRVPERAEILAKAKADCEQGFGSVRIHDVEHLTAHSVEDGDKAYPFVTIFIAGNFADVDSLNDRFIAEFRRTVGEGRPDLALVWRLPPKMDWETDLDTHRTTIRMRARAVAVPKQTQGD